MVQPAHSQATSPTVEAIKFANLRSGPGVNYPQVATIYNGKAYPLIGRHARLPWYLVKTPDTQGWVFADLVKVNGDINAVPFTEAVVNTPLVSPTAVELPAFTPTSAQAPANATSVPAGGPTPTLTLSPTGTLAVPPTPTSQSPTGVFAEAKAESNVRYGPGSDFKRIGTITKGQRYPVLRRHALFEWIEIGFEAVAGGRGWVSLATVDITGNLNAVPTTSSRDFGYPTLTPTPQMVVSIDPPWTVQATGQAPANAAANPTLTKLSNDIYDYLLKLGFEPGTAQQGSAFLYDLRSGQAISLNGGIAYSGMSLIKIPILVTLFRVLDTPPSEELAVDIGQMMVCSNNLYSNAVLGAIGNGDVYSGAEIVTQTMQQLGLKDTFMVGPFRDDPKVTPRPINTIKTGVDQVSTGPDSFNQSSPASLGWLLSAIYQCAVAGSGPLTAAFPGQMDSTKCRKMIRALSADQIGTMIEGGVPKTGVLVAHKHGWIDDTRGDAALILSPGGDYVLTVILHGKSGEFMAYDSSFPVIAEVSRMVYNAYNPTQPLGQIRRELVPETCTLDPALLADMRTSQLPPIR